jgi:hypothetical protein
VRPPEPYGCRREKMIGWLTLFALAVAAAILAMSLGILGAAVVCG